MCRTTRAGTALRPISWPRTISVNDSSYYVDLGINGSGYNDPAYSIGGPNTAYLYSASSNLTIGTASDTGVLKFHAGGTTAADEVMRITYDHLVGINTTNPSATLDVIGDGRFTGMLTVGGYADFQNLHWGDASGTNTTSTNFFATNADLTNLSVSNTATLAGSFYVPSLGGTSSTNQDIVNDVLSTGWVSGGAITDAGSETVNVAAGVGYIRLVNSPTAQIYRITWPAASGLSVPTNTNRNIYISYNSGDPIVVADANEAPNTQQYIEIGEVHNIGGTLEIHFLPRNSGDMMNRIQTYTAALIGNRIASGENVGSTSTRYIEISAGDIWDFYYNEHLTSDFDSATSGTFSNFYRDGSGGFNVETGQTQWENTKIDSPAGTLTTMTDGYYANRWVIRNYSGDVGVIYGTAEYATEADALAATPPTARPEPWAEHGWNVAQIVFQKNATSAADIVSIKPTIGGSSGGTTGGGVTNHNELFGLQGGQPGQYYHLTAAEHSFLTNTSTPSDGAILFSDSAGISYDQADFTWDRTSNVLTVNGGIVATNATATNLYATDASFAGLTVAGATPASIDQLTFADGTSTDWFGFATASGTVLHANTLYSPNAYLTGGTLDNVSIGDIVPAGAVFTKVTATNATATTLAFTSASGSSLTIAGQSVCLQDGTDCPPTPTLAQITAAGATTTDLIYALGGIHTMNLTASGTLDVTGQTTLADLTATNVTTTNLFASGLTQLNDLRVTGSSTLGLTYLTSVTTTALSVPGYVYTDLIPSVDATLALGSSGLRWNANFATVTTTNLFATTVSSTNGLFTNVTSSHLYATTGVMEDLTATNALFTNATATTFTALSDFVVASGTTRADLGITAFPGRVASTDEVGLTLNKNATVRSGLVNEVRWPALELRDQCESTRGSFDIDDRCHLPARYAARESVLESQTPARHLWDEL